MAPDEFRSEGLSPQKKQPRANTDFVLVGSFLCLVLGALLVFSNHRGGAEEKKLPLTPPPKELVHFHFGYRETLADVFWIRALQDFFSCDRQVDDLRIQHTKVCDKSWVFHMLDLITDLAPKFGMPYYYGATVLSVIINDRIGAKRIFDKGVANIPDNWDIAYRAAYHYLIELKDNEGAARLLVQAGNNGAPAWVFSLAGRLYSEEGKAYLAKSVLMEALEAQLKAPKPDEPAIYKIRQRLEQVERELKESQEKAAKSPPKSN